MDGLSELFNALQQWFLIVQEHMAAQDQKLDILLALAQKNNVLNITQRSGGVDVKDHGMVQVKHDMVAGDETVNGDSKTGG